MTKDTFPIAVWQDDLNARVDRDAAGVVGDVSVGDGMGNGSHHKADLSCCDGRWWGGTGGEGLSSIFFCTPECPLLFFLFSFELYFDHDSLFDLEEKLEWEECKQTIEKTNKASDRWTYCKTDQTCCSPLEGDGADVCGCGSAKQASYK